ncbi:MAG: hypothetical protein RLZZ432_401 [Chloroflexota bacterium]|jgi:hypothetical protein
MAKWPWEYLFTVFNAKLGSFYTPFWVANLVLLVATIVIYSVATRGSRGNGVLGDEWEQILWIGVGMFGMNLVYAAFQWYGLFPIFTTAIGLWLLRSTVLRKFPPLLAAEALHAERLRARRQASDGVEATIKRAKRRAKR